MSPPLTAPWKALKVFLSRPQGCFQRSKRTQFRQVAMPFKTEQGPWSGRREGTGNGLQMPPE